MEDFPLEPREPTTIARPLNHAVPLGRAARGGVRRWLWIAFTLAIVLGIGPCVAGILFPSHRSPGSVRRVTCASQLRQIAVASIDYASDNRGRFEESLERLVAARYLGPGNGSSSILVCPASADSPASGATTEAVIASLAAPGHCSYAYVGNGVKFPTGGGVDVVLAYDRVANHASGSTTMTNVAFADGHVESLAPAEMRPILAQVGAGMRPVRRPPATRPGS